VEHCGTAGQATDNVEHCGTAGQATDDNLIRRMLFTCWTAIGYICTLGICNTCCFSAATMVERKRLSVRFIRILPLFLCDETITWRSLYSVLSFPFDGSF
jgi:hypothetical protein